MPFAALDAATGHGFTLKMVVYHRLPYSALTLQRLLSAFWEDHAGLLLVAAAYALVQIARRRLDLATCALLAGLILLPTAGVVGADSNHLLFLGFAAAWCATALLAALAQALLTQRAAGVRIRLTLGAALTVFMVVLMGYVAQAAQPAGWYDADLRRPSPAEQEQWRLIVTNVRANPGTAFFADDPGVLALAGKDTAYDDPFTMTALAAGGGWDASAFEQHLRRGDFSLVLLGGDVFAGPDDARALRGDVLTPTMRAAMQAGYRLLFRDIVYTYVPRR